MIVIIQMVARTISILQEVLLSKMKGLLIILKSIDSLNVFVFLDKVREELNPCQVFIAQVNTELN